MTAHHPQVDFDKWAAIFPIETFEQTSGPHQFETTKPGDPLDRWKAPGTSITSPAQLCHIELVRKPYSKKFDLGEAVPVDIFLWKTAPPDKPYLTKLGGVPHREADKPWPTDAADEPYTFVAQFCFADSNEIVSEYLPGDVMLIFFENSKSYFQGLGDLHIEWSSLELTDPITAADCPEPGFVVPQLSGVRYRCNEYPEFPKSWDVFEQQGHYNYTLFTVTKSTKIGRVANFIQGDIRENDRELICTLNSLTPRKEWPFTDLEELPSDANQPDTHYSWGKYRMMFGDVGCMYFFVDDHGTVTWHSDCY